MEVVNTERAPHQATEPFEPSELAGS